MRFFIFKFMPAYRRLTGSKYTRDLQNFKNIHPGKRIWIIATGPSLREEDILKLRNEITIGVNGTIYLYNRIGWKPTYFCCGDPVGYLLFKTEIDKAKIKNVFLSLLCKKNAEDMVFKPHYYDCYLKDCRWPSNNKRLKKYVDFSEDVGLQGVYSGGRSITTEAVQIAAYMGAKEIYLYGQDCDYSGRKHFYDMEEEEVWTVDGQTSFNNAMIIFFENAKKYAERKGIKIYNATRGGKLEIFERVDLDEVLKDS